MYYLDIYGMEELSRKKKENSVVRERKKNVCCEAIAIYFCQISTERKY